MVQSRAQLAVEGAFHFRREDSSTASRHGREVAGHPVAHLMQRCADSACDRVQLSVVETVSGCRMIGCQRGRRPFLIERVSNLFESASDHSSRVNDKTVVLWHGMLTSMPGRFRTTSRSDADNLKLLTQERSCAAQHPYYLPAENLQPHHIACKRTYIGLQETYYSELW